ncbi:MAG: hypothetical protein R3E72_11115 [Steroidobacteraceae bacterium]
MPSPQAGGFENPSVNNMPKFFWHEYVTGALALRTEADYSGDCQVIGRAT